MNIACESSPATRTVGSMPTGVGRGNRGFLECGGKHRASMSLAVIVLLNTAPIAAQAQPLRWENDINALTEPDQISPPPAGALLFVGSSSIRLWSTLEQDFSNYPVVQRGFGGSEMSDVLYYAPRIVLPYRPRMVVIYAGDNDLANSKTPRQVHQDFVRFVQLLHEHLPDCRVAFIAIKPSPARWHLATEIRTANALVKTACESNSMLDYLDVFQPMLDSDGQPRADLFQDDRLHLSAGGYALWTGVIKQHLPSPDHFSIAKPRPPGLHQSDASR